MQHDTLREGVLEGRIDTRDEETAKMRVSHWKQSGFLCLAGQSAIQHKRFPCCSHVCGFADEYHHANACWIRNAIE